MPNECEFKVLTKPLPQPRPKFSARGKFVKAYTPGTVMGRSLKEYKAAIRSAAAETGWALTDRPCRVEIEVVIKPPKSLLTKDGKLKDNSRTTPTAQRDGDVDNYAKTVLDALQPDIAFADDTQIIQLLVTKRWGLLDEEGCYVKITEVAGLARSASGEEVPDL